MKREISGSQLSSQEPTGSAPVSLTTLKDFEVEDRDFTHFFDVLRVGGIIIAFACSYYVVCLFI